MESNSHHTYIISYRPVNPRSITHWATLLDDNFGKETTCICKNILKLILLFLSINNASQDERVPYHLTKKESVYLNWGGSGGETIHYDYIYELTDL